MKYNKHKVRKSSEHGVFRNWISSGSSDVIHVAGSRREATSSERYLRVSIYVKDGEYICIFCV